MNLSKEVEEILSKYNKEEVRVDKLLQESTPVIESDVKQTKKRNYLSLEEAVKRNKELLKNLETIKGNLRSKAIYSPSEMQWELICKQYQTTPSLPVTSWKCQVSVFVLTTVFIITGDKINQHWSFFFALENFCFDVVVSTSSFILIRKQFVDGLESEETVLFLMKCNGRRINRQLAMFYLEAQFVEEKFEGSQSRFLNYLGESLTLWNPSLKRITLSHRLGRTSSRYWKQRRK